MSDATALFTYLWHYLVARLLYDDLVRPLVRHDRTALLALIGAMALVAIVLRRRTR